MDPQNNTSSKNDDVFAAMKKNNRTSLIIFLLIFVGFTVYSMLSGSNSSNVEFGDNFLRLSAPSEENPFECTIYYDDIESVRTIFKDEKYDLGEMVSGTETKKLNYGTWKNAEFGEYTLYASPKFNTYTVINTTKGVVVMNIEGAETTENFTSALAKLLYEEGYWSTESGK